MFYVPHQVFTREGGSNSTIHHAGRQVQCQSGVHSITGKIYLEYWRGHIEYKMGYKEFWRGYIEY